MDEWEVTEEEYIESCRKAYRNGTGKRRSLSIRKFRQWVLGKAYTATRYVEDYEKHKLTSTCLESAIYEILEAVFKIPNMSHIRVEDLPKASEVVKQLLGMIEDARTA